MATVLGKTSIKIDELLNGSVISGHVDSSGHLILTTRGGADLDGGYIAKPFGGAWSPTTPYVTGDVVGYAGLMWKALSDNTDKPPALYTSNWTRLAGESSNDWAEKDPYFTGDSFGESWDVATKTGTPTVALTSVAGEFETGIQALKISCPISAVQTFFQKEENIVRGGEIITVTVRAKLQSAAAGARLDITMLQNLAARPEPGASGNTSSSSTEGAQALTTSWATYNFTVTCANAKPRAMVDLVASADGAGSAVFLIDRIRITRASNPALEAWPVGSIFMTISPTNPKQLLGGGTWVAWAEGRMPIGVDAAQTEFDTVEETGGSKTKTLAVGNLPAHSHAAGSLGTNTTGSGHNHSPDVGGATPGTTNAVLQRSSGSVVASVPLPGAGGTGTHTHDVTGSTADTGSGTALNVLNPYITCYMWKRTA